MTPSGTSPSPHDSEDPAAWLAVAALGGLEQAEQDALAAILAGRPDLAEELETYRDVAGALPLSCDPIPPSAAMTANLMARVKADSDARFGRTALLSSPEPSLLERLRLSFQRLSGSPVLMGGALAGLLIFAGLSFFSFRELERIGANVSDLRQEVQTLSGERDALAGRLDAADTELDQLRLDRQAFEGRLGQVTAENILLSREIAALASEKAALEERLAAMTNANLTFSAEAVEMDHRLTELEKVTGLFTDPASQTFRLPGTKEQPEASGQLIINPTSDLAVLAVANLPPLDSGMTYQVLLIRGGEHDTAETFQVSPSGQQFLLVHAPFPFETFDSVAVSIEPAGGSPQRTGEIVLLGPILN